MQWLKFLMGAPLFYSWKRELGREKFENRCTNPYHINAFRATTRACRGKLTAPKCRWKSHGFLCLIAKANASSIVWCWFREVFKQLTVFLRGEGFGEGNGGDSCASQPSPHHPSWRNSNKTKSNPFRNECVYSEKQECCSQFFHFF